jgi:hypothetical protein
VFQKVAKVYSACGKLESDKFSGVGVIVKKTCCCVNYYADLVM